MSLHSPSEMTGSLSLGGGRRGNAGIRCGGGWGEAMDRVSWAFNWFVRLIAFSLAFSIQDTKYEEKKKKREKGREGT